MGGFLNDLCVGQFFFGFFDNLSAMIDPTYVTHKPRDFMSRMSRDHDFNPCRSSDR